MRTRISWLMLIALVVRGLLPAGFMLVANAGAHGAFSVVICSGSGPQLLELDAEGNPAPSGKSRGSHELCPFAMLAAPVLAPEPPTLEATLRITDIIYRREWFGFAADLRPGATSARGPPQII